MTPAALPENPTPGLRVGTRMWVETSSGGQWVDFANAQSFGDYDRYLEAQHVEEGVRELTTAFQVLVDNIFSAYDVTLPEKARRIAAVAGELQTRLSDPQSAAADDTSTRELAKPEGFGARVGGLLTRFLAPAPTATREGPTLLSEDPGAVTVYKEADGGYRWLTIHSNTYWDRLGERFPIEAHRDYLDYVERTKDYPPLRFWHVPGADFGRADWLGMYEVDGQRAFMLGSGRFDPQFNDVAEKLAARKDLACSHGYTYRRRDLVDGEYRAYRGFEISFLPVGREANELTAFIADKEVPMLTPDKRSELVGLIGEERTKAIEQGVDTLAKAAGERGIGFREFVESLTATAPTPAATAPAAGGEITPAATAPAAAQPFDVEAVRAMMTEATAAALAPLAAQVTALTAKVDGVDQAQKSLAETWAPRGFRGVGVREVLPDDDPAVKAAKEGDQGEGVPGGMGFYFPTAAAPAVPAS